MELPGFEPCDVIVLGPNVVIDVLGFWIRGVSVLLLWFWARRPGSKTRATPARPHKARLTISFGPPFLVHMAY